MKWQGARSVERGDVLVAILNNRADFANLEQQGWYRVPCDTAPRRWPPRWLAFYQTKVFEAEAFAVRYYGRVQSIQVVRRHELFPHEGSSTKADRLYYKVQLHDLQQREQPIMSRRGRRLVFVPTTWHKFSTAVEINDLFDDSPLEDRVWAEFKRPNIAAERQWDVQVRDGRYLLDFALFCLKGRIDVETDGDTWHATPERIPEDNQRNNALEADGWHVLRFNGAQVRESLAEYCVPKVTSTINHLGGLSDDGIVPRRFITHPAGSVQQLSLFGPDAPDEGTRVEHGERHKD